MTVKTIPNIYIIINNGSKRMTYCATSVLVTGIINHSWHSFQ